MRFKSAKILLFVLGILIVTAIVYTLIQRTPKSNKPFATTEFKRIEIKSKDTLSIIEKVGETWKITEPMEYPVDTSIFYPLLERLKDLEIGEVVSKREAKHADFEVDTIKGIEVKVHWDSRSKSFIIGKMAGDFLHWYIRFPPAPETYISKGLSKFLIDKRPDDWRDHTMFSFDSEDVKELHLGDKKLVRTDDTLWMLGKEVIEDKKVKPILDILSNLRCDGFSEETEEFETELEVKIVLVEGEEKILYIGEKTDDNNQLACVKGIPTFYLLNSWKIDRLKNLP